MALESDFPLQNETATIFARITEGNGDEAIRLANELLAKDSTNAVGWYLRGMLYKLQGDTGSAISAYNKALQHKPDFRKACEDLGHLLLESEQNQLAFKTYQHFIRIRLMETAQKPQPSKTTLSTASNKAMVDYVMQSQSLHNQGKLEDAAAASRKAHVIDPTRVEVSVNLALLLNALYRFDEAEDILLKAIALKPDYGLAYNLLGNAYKGRNDYGKAIAAYQLSCEYSPKLLDPFINLGKTYFEMQLYSESVEAYERTLDRDPEYLEALMEVAYLRDMLCRWNAKDNVRERMVTIMESGKQAGEPFIAMLYTSLKLQLNNAMRWTVKQYAATGGWDAKLALPSLKRGSNKLRIGYLSSDFHRHATLALISQMFEHHDRGRFEVYAYSHGRDDGLGERKRVKEAVDCFRDIRTLSDKDAVELMREDGIDILIDLKGYTQGHRLGLLARRPAPLQIHYLGYPGTSGAPFVDYFLADAVSAPKGIDNYFTEKLIRLPHSYQINDRARPLPHDGPGRAHYGLPEKGFVFCGFNNNYKINAEIFSVWMELLTAVEGSVLWLMETHEEAGKNMRKEAAAHGIDPARIITAVPIPLPPHLERYRHADLFIDSFPVCGHTTSSDALWCGVPVVTLAGDSFISRVAASLLHAVGLPELVTTNIQDYKALALSLTRDPARLAKLKHHLNEGRMSFPLFDSLATTRAIEAAYEYAAEQHRQGRPPKAFGLTPELGIL